MQEMASLETMVYPVILATFITLVGTVAFNIVRLFRESEALTAEEEELYEGFDTLLPENAKILSEDRLDSICHYEDFDRKLDTKFLQ